MTLLPLLLAAALGAEAEADAPARAAARALALHRAPPALALVPGDGLGDEDDGDGAEDDLYADGWDDGAERPRVILSAWAGEALSGGGSGRGAGFFAAGADWAFDAIDLGVQGAAYRGLEDASREWTPVAVARLTQRFRTRRGFEAAFGFGVGAGRPAGWIAWYQVALGLRVPLGPLFLGGELTFEQYDLLRLGGGLGVAF